VEARVHPYIDEGVVAGMRHGKEVTSEPDVINVRKEVNVGILVSDHE
jgi:hypothetical protein